MSTPDLNDDQGNLVILSGGRVIAYHPEIAKFFDDQPDIAVYFQQLYHWQQFTTREDRYFYKSATELYKETGVSAKRQRKCREVLEDYGWINTKKEMANGHPTIHFTVLITLETVVNPLGQKTNGNSQKDKSITRDDTQESKYSSEMQEKIQKCYRTWLIYMVIDPEDRRLATTDEHKQSLVDAAKKRTRLTDTRKSKMAARIKSMGIDAVLTAIKNIAKSDWHRGENPSNWKADIEFLCGKDEKIEEWANK